MNFDGLASIVTGGASGLGLATAEMLVRNGAKVTIFDLNTVAGEAAAMRLGIRYAPVDVTDDAEVEAAVAAAQVENGVARLLVNCAGVAPSATLLDRGPRDDRLQSFRLAINVNLVGTFITCSRFANRLVAHGLIGEERGVIVNTSSVAAYDGQIGQVGYTASKAGVNGLTLPMARELAPHGIRVVAIAPGLFSSGMTDATLSAEAQEGLGRQVPFPSRLGRPAEYAQLVESIVANPMLNGEVIRIDGALSLSALRMDDLLVSRGR